MTGRSVLRLRRDSCSILPFHTSLKRYIARYTVSVVFARPSSAGSVISTVTSNAIEAFSDLEIKQFRSAFSSACRAQSVSSSGR